MALEEYKRKRDFGKTAEPPPGRIKARKEELSYLIQKHDATRLHYDFRLELGGRPPELGRHQRSQPDPVDKRLAVRTEDHPLSYGTFEGTIPKGQYGGGTVMLWDEGTWEPKGDPRAGLKKGHLSFTLHGERLKGDWDLIRMHGDDKKENWLLIKARDAEARDNGQASGFLDDHAFSVTSGRSMEAIASGEKPAKRARLAIRKAREARKTCEDCKKRRRSSRNAFCAGEAISRPCSLPRWSMRRPKAKSGCMRSNSMATACSAFSRAAKSSLRTRNGLDWTSKFPSVATALEGLKAKTAVLDMEAVVLDENGKSGFQALQAALGEGGRRDRIVAYAFDLLHLDGEDLTVPEPA